MALHFLKVQWSKSVKMIVDLSRRAVVGTTFHDCDSSRPWVEAVCTASVSFTIGWQLLHFIPVILLAALASNCCTKAQTWYWRMLESHVRDERKRLGRDVSVSGPRPTPVWCLLLEWVGNWIRVYDCNRAVSCVCLCMHYRVFCETICSMAVWWPVPWT